MLTESEDTEARDSGEFMVGDHVGRFQVLGRVGQGAMGIVYAAHDPQLERRVALKVLLDDRAEERGTRLLDEARSMARLAHPSAVTVFDVGTQAGRFFLAMEFVDGSTLGDWLRATRPSTTLTVALFMDVALALGAAHRAGIVHRDVKPQNILVSREGRPKVTDFGLANATASCTAADADVMESTLPMTTLHRSRGLVGTPAYMAPEVLLGERADARADQFSFAVCLHEALVGKRPYVARTISELQALVRDRPPAIDPSLPAILRTVLARALAREPEARFPSMGELAEALARGNASLATNARPRRRLNYALGASALALAALLSLLVRRELTRDQSAVVMSTAEVAGRTVARSGADGAEHVVAPRGTTELTSAAVNAPTENTRDARATANVATKLGARALPPAKVRPALVTNDPTPSPAANTTPAATPAAEAAAQSAAPASEPVPPANAPEGWLKRRL